ncbi:dual specificity mitogen-activated protein kinase kinase 7-like [Leptopilina boulardi]|uniref:dual specificity mitogen-activated protein kinase kinase 7-like n=1 Tax=Leptopilina boulardi TaxID=63433 RepID=UPI0021F5807C|nr:dual specificity mitogen-activated protein kinase kinase 7-like [Leptopilina boulardi]
MSSTLENKILNLQERLRAENESRDGDRQSNENTSCTGMQKSSVVSITSPAPRRPRQLGEMGTPTRIRRLLDLPVLQMLPPKMYDSEFELKLQEIMKMNGILNINGQKYQTEMKDLEHLGELGNGTCGHVVRMKHKPSGVVIAVKQMRRSGNAEENKRIIMDLDVVLKSHDCPYIVQCLGCFITESDVWICMELMATCLDKLLKNGRQAIPESFLGKVTVATVKALSYLKEKHGVIHRDVKPSNILLDNEGGVKLCDFGISGRLVDSKAKTRSAGCAAYMAPERIDPPDPTKPDYDIRADVWSLGITLVELATGVFPYRDCKTDFEVLSRVVQDDPPSLPPDALFSKEFRNFVNCCLTKNYKHRPKYHKLMEHPFIKKHDFTLEGETNVMNTTTEYQWFNGIMDQLEPRIQGGLHRPTGHVSSKDTVTFKGKNETSNSSSITIESQNINCLPVHQRSFSDNIANYVPYSPYALRRKESKPFSPQMIRDNGDINLQRSFLTYRHFMEQKNLTFNRTSINSQSRDDGRSYSSYQSHTEQRESSGDLWQTARSQSPHVRDYSPWRRENVDPPGVIPPVIENGRHTSYVQSRLEPVPQTHLHSQDIYGSPMINRKRFPSETQSQNLYNSHGSELLMRRLGHQMKQEPPSTIPQFPVGSKESAKKRLTSYVRLRLGIDRVPSPEPPSRLSRGESPLPLRRHIMEQPSPSFSRRYISSSPPQPPPRRLSESCSVPGSPQHIRAYLRYTPEPQRRPPPS